ncbi:sulfotransferase 1E1-like [Drosophila busckii]|uniref:sulfotransferase 1E1-like n=1 Tax=Drosophila busckii TaxID=30019 RepID=UPI00083EFF89|nr:sulfotransferase 1E1-like [Drosophila busckii]
MEWVQITPQSYPVNLLAKDWSARPLYLSSFMQEFPAMIHDMEVLPDDVWLVSYPKTGTTWLQELLWLLLNGLDFTAALSKDLELRSPYLEFDFVLHRDEQRALKPVLELPSPRLIKSHLPLALLPAQLWQGKGKVVYIFRNPIDAWVSSYYHMITVGFIHSTTLEQFMDERLDTEFPKRAALDHAAEFYQLRNEPWVYYTSYERMKSNLRGVVEDLCQFLNKTVTEQQMERLLKHLSFEEMKKNPTTNHRWEHGQRPKQNNNNNEVYNFIRRGKVGGYKDVLSPQLIDKANAYIEQRLQANNVTLAQLLLLDDDNVKESGAVGAGAALGVMLLLLLSLLAPMQANMEEHGSHLTKRYSDQTVHGYMTERTCWWNEVCKEEFQNLFRCKCPQYSYCRSPGRYYNAYCSMTDTGYIWTQLALGTVER